MFDPSSFLPTLEQRLRRALLRLPRAGDDGLLSVTLVLPWAPPVRPPEQGRWIYWEQPRLSRTLLGLEPLPLAQSAGPQRFDTLDRGLRAATKRWETLDPEASRLRPLLFLGFAFDPEDPMSGSWAGLPNAVLLLPELLFRHDGNLAAITFTRQGDASAKLTLNRWLSLSERLLQQPGPSPAGSAFSKPLARIAQLPSRRAWLQLAKDATRATREAGLQKVVLARHLAVRSASKLDAGQLIDTLARDYPGCRLFATRLGDQVLVSASPERLIARTGERITCDAIGGTIRRAEDPSGDQILAQQMLRDPKTRREHALVVEALGASLAPVCQELNLPGEPGIFRLRNLLHLWTEINARADPTTSLLQLVRRLHPTPAVNGTPRATALDWLRAHEPFHRGWYAGGGGWLDTRGDGELAVLLRCALLRGDSADLYAGAGIVADSDPESEYAETELKLGAILQALQTESAIPDPGPELNIRLK